MTTDIPHSTYSKKGLICLYCEGVKCPEYPRCVFGDIIIDYINELRMKGVGYAEQHNPISACGSC